MSVYEKLIQKLVNANISSPRLEARLILAYLLKKEVSDVSLLYCNLSSEQESELQQICKERIINHKPLDKILGYKGFYKYDFFINDKVLSPRPDTEILLEEALFFSLQREISILDLGTGSGCILLSLLKENKNAVGTGVDISLQALEVAQINAQRLQVEKQVQWINASWFEEDFIKKINTQYDIIVSNPPYIPNKEIASLQPEVKNYDPLEALAGGEDGLNSYRRIAEISQDLLKSQGIILLECGKGQAQQVVDIFMKNRFTLCKIVRDLAGIERCIILKK